MKALTLLKRIGIGFGLLVVLFAAAQLIRPRLTEATTDPGRTIQAQLGASSELAVVIDRSCAECHSNALSSHWYTRVAPFSWAIARGAKEGRTAVNFAEWASAAARLPARVVRGRAERHDADARLSAPPSRRGVVRPRRRDHLRGGAMSTAIETTISDFLKLTGGLPT